MKARLFDNFITTLIGLIILVLAVFMFYNSKIDNVAFGSLIALGLTYCRAKDSIIGLEPK
jgi:hypothetical protein